MRYSVILVMSKQEIAFEDNSGKNGISKVVR